MSTSIVCATESADGKQNEVDEEEEVRTSLIARPAEQILGREAAGAEALAELVGHGCG